MFNVGGGSPASLADVIALFSGFNGRFLSVRYKDVEHGDVRDTAADTTLARNQLRFSPQVDLAQGLAAEFDWLREQQRAMTQVASTVTARG